jgi:hypothetical protein
MVSDWSGEFMQITRRLDRAVKGVRRHETVNIRSPVRDLSGIRETRPEPTLKIAFKEFPPKCRRRSRMQTRLARSWTALRYDLSSQRALDNAARVISEHDRLLAEIDALALRLEAAAATAPAECADVAVAPEAQRARDVA